MNFWRDLGDIYGIIPIMFAGKYFMLLIKRKMKNENQITYSFQLHTHRIKNINKTHKI